jgi:hypothetical protein
MNKPFFTLGELVSSLGLREWAIRRALNESGAWPKLSEFKQDPGERIARLSVITWFATQPGDCILAKKLAALLWDSL